MYSEKLLTFSLAMSLMLCAGTHHATYAQSCPNPPLPEEQVRSGAIANALAGKGHDAVIAGNILVRCFQKTDRSYFVRSSAHAAWYHHRIDSCRAIGVSPCTPAENSKQHSFDDLIEADRLFQQTSPGGPQYITLLAHRHEEFGDTARASVLFEESLQKDPGQADVYYHLIARETARHNFPAVEAYFERLTAATKDRRDVLSYLEHLLRSAEFAKAEKLWSSWKTLFGSDFMFRYKRLKLLALTKRYAPACDACDSLIHEYPDGMPREFHLPTKDTVYFLCAEVNLEHGEPDKSLMMYDKAVEIAPSGVHYYTRISSILNSMPQFYYENYLYLKKLVNISQQRRVNLPDVAIASSTVSEFEQAVQDLQGYLSMTPINWDSVGSLYSQIGDFKNARIAYINAAREAPTPARIFNIATAEFYLKNYKESLFHLDKELIEDDTRLRSQRKLLRVLNLAYLTNEDNNYCEMLLDELVKLGPVSPDIGENLCDVLSTVKGCKVDLAPFCPDKRQ